MPPYNLTARELYAGGREIPTSARSEQHNLTSLDLDVRRMAASCNFNLPTSTRSGHPIFPTGNRASSNYQSPAYDTASSSPLGINISPLGTWKPVKDGHPSANIEVLDLTKRFGYNADDKMKPKRRAKNALRRGFKPTLPSELPPQKRTIHEISSGDDEADEEEEDGVTVSDASPLRAKRRRMASGTNRAKPHLSALDELRAAAAKSASPVMSRTQPSFPEISRARANHPETNPSDSSNSPHTVQQEPAGNPTTSDFSSPPHPPPSFRQANQASTTDDTAPSLHEPT
ncbi:MAG: hypothetical protein LQ346_007784, partial [Caloplaca aetnensis]